jgi:hypothetical protein
MTRTLQWRGESKLFTAYEQVFKHDVQGFKEKKKSYHHTVSVKERKNSKKYQDID